MTNDDGSSQGDSIDRATPPLVSLIVPVRNGAARIGRCIEALLDQTYPRDRYEVIIVDNGSDDGTQEIIRSYPVTLLEETSAASPYVARNLGLRHARGEIYAFTDGGCVPRSDWLAQGVHSLEQGADFAGGRVTFEMPAEPTAAEIYDSLVNIQMEDAVRKRKVGKGCNLFFRKAVFDRIGPWPEQRSGGDVLHTATATSEGFRIVYAERAEVLYPTRTFRPLLRKSLRVGLGHPYQWDTRGWRLFVRVLRIAVLIWKPPSKAHIRELMQRDGHECDSRRVAAVWRVAWASSIAAKLGHLYSGTRILLGLGRTP